MLRDSKPEVRIVCFKKQLFQHNAMSGHRPSGHHTQKSLIVAAANLNNTTTLLAVCTCSIELSCTTSVISVLCNLFKVVYIIHA